jgi:hypothetical protein
MEAVIFSETSINIHLITRSRRQPSLVSSPWKPHISPVLNLLSGWDTVSFLEMTGPWN